MERTGDERGHTREFVFDRERCTRFNKRRMETLDKLLLPLIEERKFSTSLDVGCGIGMFSNYLLSLGLETVALDAREGNIDEARKRYPAIEFHVCDVEDPEVAELGTFDLVLCVGLLYHLENPFRAIRNLESMTGKLMIIESMITPGSSPVSTLVDEGQVEDQSLQCIAYVPSEACLIKMLYHAGFSHVFRLKDLPDHEDFRNYLTHRRKRTMLVASRFELGLPILRLKPEPSTRDLWKKWIGYLKDYKDLVFVKLRTRRSG